MREQRSVSRGLPSVSRRLARGLPSVSLCGHTGLSPSPVRTCEGAISDGRSYRDR